MQVDRRTFIGGALAAGAFGGCRWLDGFGARAATPNYWCTWATQGQTVEGYKATGEIRFAGDQGIVGIRENLNEQVLFREKAGWAEALYPEARSEMNFLLDDGWDVGFGFNPWQNCDQFGSMILHEKRFPSFTGTPAERLAKLVAAVRDRGWRGLGLWVAPQMPGESWSHREPDDKAYEDLRRKIGWCGEAGVSYLKVDWGSRDGDIEYRRRMSEYARELAPGMLIEHCRTWGVPLNGVQEKWVGNQKKAIPGSGRCEGDHGFDQRVRKHAEALMAFSDVFRIYDMTEPIFTTQAIERTQVLARIAEKVGGSCYINVEDVPYLGAALGQSLGIMRAPIWPAKRGRDVTRRREATGEVTRAVAWQRIAPPFRSRADYPTRRTDATLTDSWTFSADDTWFKGVHGQTIPQKAPAVTTRGLAEFPVVTDVGEGVPFICAMRHPNGALAVAAMPRLDDKKGYQHPAADVYVPADATDVPVGVFGRYHTLTLDLPKGRGRVIVRDLAGTKEHDITAQCAFAAGRVTLPGDLLAKIGTEAIADCSEPGALVTIV